MQEEGGNGRQQSYDEGQNEDKHTFAHVCLSPVVELLQPNENTSHDFSSSSKNVSRSLSRFFISSASMMMVSSSTTYSSSTA